MAKQTQGYARWLNQAALLLSVPLLLVAWQYVSVSGVVNRILFPPPTEVTVALYQAVRDGTLIRDVLASLNRVLVGYVTGAAAGIVVGLLTGRYALISNLLTPIFQLLRPIPPIAFVPIVVLWFGLTEFGKYFLVFWGVFFTVWIAAHYGVQKVDPMLLRAARSLGTSERNLLVYVMFPAAVPYIFVGLRTSVSISFYTLVGAELAGAFAGLAYRIELAQQNMQTAQVMGGLVMLGVISALADRTFNFLARRFVWW
ncbi:MAG TPA: ABC transporter permease [Pseudolabrys sp.]|nr:ABC transporter permease [Pseudolabrys sp.]